MVQDLVTSSGCSHFSGLLLTYQAQQTTYLTVEQTALELKARKKLLKTKAYLLVKFIILVYLLTLLVSWKTQSYFSSIGRVNLV